VLRSQVIPDEDSWPLLSAFRDPARDAADPLARHRFGTRHTDAEGEGRTSKRRLARRRPRRPRAAVLAEAGLLDQPQRRGPQRPGLLRKPPAVQPLGHRPVDMEPDRGPPVAPGVELGVVGESLHSGHSPGPAAR
jgi:hypothetical protein